MHLIKREPNSRWCRRSLHLIERGHARGTTNVSKQNYIFPHVWIIFLFLLEVLIIHLNNGGNVILSRAI
jgi:hypothetical protein